MSNDQNSTTNPKPVGALTHASSYSRGPERAGEGRGKDAVMLRRIENAGALLRGADEGLRRAGKALRLALEEAQTARRIADTARAAFSQVCGDVEYQSWITEAAADAEMKSWGIAA